MSDITPPVFNGTLYQCQSVDVSWTGGEFPVRVAAFYQLQPTDDWRSAGLTSEAANSHVVEWQVNAPAGSTAWMTLVDHTGTYRQTTTGVVVQPSDDSSCLDNAKTAAVVTQTVYMSGEGNAYYKASGLDGRSLTIMTIVFGICFFIALAGALYIFSLLRQARKIKRGPRFSLAEEDDEDSLHALSSAAVAKKERQAQFSFDAGSESGGTLSMRSVLPPAGTASYYPAYQHSPRESVSSQGGAPASSAAPLMSNASIMRSTSIHNPFLDTPIAPNTLNTSPSTGVDDHDRKLSSAGHSHDSAFGYPSTVARTPRSSNATAPTVLAAARPPFAHRPSSASIADTTATATSMQHIWGNSAGPLRVANDPRSISTPDISRVPTQSSLNSRYPLTADSSSRGEAMSTLSRAATNASTSSSAYSNPTNAAGASRDGSGGDGASLSAASAASSSDHYATEQHSSRAWLPAAKR